MSDVLGELRECRKAGDTMQSSLSRVIDYVTTQTLPYEVRMAVHEGASAIDDWTEARKLAARTYAQLADADRIAQAFHEVYEELAPRHAYRTREESAKPWDEVPAQNKALMIDTVATLIERGVIVP